MSQPHYYLYTALIFGEEAKIWQDEEADDDDDDNVGW